MATNTCLWMAPFACEPEVVESVPPPGFRPTWIEVDLSALDHNLTFLRGFLPPTCAVMAVVKDNAYGHGILPVARRVAPQADMLGVAILEEAVLLRRAGLNVPLFVLGGLWPGQEPLALQLGAVPAVLSVAALERLQAAARDAGVVAAYHVKVDTGMNRLGVLPGELAEFLDRAGTCAHTRCEGLMTHLACADSPDPASTRTQLARFGHCRELLLARGLAPRWIHAANSAGLLDHPAAHFDLVRPGIALYGYDPRRDLRGRALRPVLALRSRIRSVNEIPAGSAVGYGAGFVASATMRLATVPIGYGDGYSRLWSNQGSVLAGGRRCAVVGRVSMDTIAVDVTESPDAQEGADVILIDASGELAWDAAGMAERLGTISYEVLTSLSPRLARCYTQT